MLKKTLQTLLLLLALFVYSQNKIEVAIEKLQTDFPQEKIHLQYNQNIYIAGETVWFKAFVFSGYHRSDISSTLFVELYDEKKNILTKKMFPIIKGESQGSFELSNKLEENVYFVRAYTSWMANFDEDFQYLHSLKVYNPSSPLRLEKNTNSDWTATIHPESGSLIEGLENKIAVRLHSNASLPTKWKGQVVDENSNKNVINFENLDQNIAVFKLNPENGKRYTLLLEDEKGRKQQVTLPSSKQSGVLLQVNSLTDKIDYALKPMNVENTEFFQVIGTIDNVVVFKAKHPKNESNIKYSIPTKSLINGILNLSVFDDKDNVIAQRLCFVQPKKLAFLKPNIINANLNTQARKLNTFEIKSNSDIFYYTVKVEDEEAHQLEEENILTSLWLTQDFTSKIHNPAQYFNNNSNSEALDGLLISEKWKRFDWQSIIAGKYPIITYVPQKFLAFQGAASKGGQKLANEEVNIIYKIGENDMTFQQAKTNSNGNFIIDQLLFENELDIRFQSNKENKNKDVNNQQISAYFTPLVNYVPFKKPLPKNEFVLTENRIDTKNTDKIIENLVINKKNNDEMSEKFHLIEEVTIKADKTNQTNLLNKKLSSSAFRSMDETILDLVNDNEDSQSYRNIFQYLQGRIAGLQFEMMNGQYYPKLRGGQPGLFLNEMPVQADVINNIPISDIAMVKVMKTSFGANRNPNGGILIYLKNGSTYNKSSNTGATALKGKEIKGYDSEAIPLMNPNYSNSVFNDIKIDSRSNLCWFAKLKTDVKKPSEVNFYNNDTAKKFRVTILGFNDVDGSLLYFNEVIN